MNDAMNPEPPAMEEPPMEEPSANKELQELMQQFKAGAGWFYFVAALSIINTVLMTFDVGWAFFFGLGITQVFDGLAAAIAAEIGEGPGVWIVRGVALAFNLGISGFFVLFGWLSQRGYGIAYIIGMVLFLLDGLIFLLASDWGGLVFHAIALFLMFRGYGALRKIRALQAQQAVMQ